MIEAEKRNLRSPKVIAITGGKGGVGKTSIAINLAITLSKLGSRVCLLDADTGLANINVMLGMHSAYTLEHLLTGEKNIRDVMVEGPERVDIIPGASGFAGCVDLDFGQQQRLLAGIKTLEPHYDYMLVDTAAGISPSVLHFIAAAQVAALVVTPEPTSLTDAFSLLKVLRRRGYKRSAQVIVNMTPTPAKAEKVFRRFDQAVNKYLGLNTEFLGSVWMDESMRTAVTLQRPVALFPKSDPSARSFYRLAERLQDIYARKNLPALPFSLYWQKLIENGYSRSQKPNKVVLSESTSDSHKSAEKPALTIASSEGVTVDTLQTNAESEWVNLRSNVMRFVGQEDTTPEQVNTLIYGIAHEYGDRFGLAAVDLIHGLIRQIEPSMLNEEHAIMLREDFAYLNIAESEQESKPQVEKTIEYTDNEDDYVTVQSGKALQYDSTGYGAQAALAQKIRKASGRVPLESLLESIKYSSLKDE